MKMSLLPLILLPLALVAGPAAADEWNHAITPYIWGAGLDADVTIRGQDAGNDASFTDVLDNVEFAAMLRYGGHSENWGVMIDGLYLGMGFPSETTPAEVDMDAFVVEAAGSWHANDHFELIFGARYYDVEMEADFAVLTDVDQSKSWVDAIAGFRGNASMTDAWSWYFRGDIGAGGSDFSWNAETAFVWMPGDHFTLALGWRALSADYQEGTGTDEFALDVTLSGPVVGFGYRF